MLFFKWTTHVTCSGQLDFTISKKLNLNLLKQIYDSKFEKINFV